MPENKQHHTDSLGYKHHKEVSISSQPMGVVIKAVVRNHWKLSYFVIKNAR